MLQRAHSARQKAISSWSTQTKAWEAAGIALQGTIMVQLVSPRHDDVAGCVQSGRLNRAHQLATDTVTAMETRREVKRHESVFGQKRFSWRPGGARAHRLV